MNVLEQELINTQLALESGVKLQTRVDDDGMVRSEVFIPEPQGFYAAGEAPTMQELGVTGDAKKVAGAGLSTMAGMAGGAFSGLMGIVPDLIALGAGPNTQEAADKMQTAYGTEAWRQTFFDFVDTLDVPEPYKFLAKDAAMVGEVTGLPGAAAAVKGAPKVAGAIGDAVSDYAAGAPARVAERQAGVTLGAGVDPTAIVDDAIVAGQKLAKGADNPNQAMDDALAQAQARYFEPDNFEPPTAENPVSVVRPTETEPGIIAFHGSGADFDQFRLEMIGTGEGAQAYGYGLYFTDSEDIARFYRDTVSTGKTRIPYGGSEDAAQAVPDNVPYLDVDGYRSYSMGDAEEVLDSVLTKQYAGDNPGQEIIDFNLEILKKAGVLNAEMPDGSFVTMLVDQSGGQFTVTPVKQQTGKIYKVAITPKPEEMLDYQTTFADQPQSVQDALVKIGYEVDKDKTGQINSEAFKDARRKRPMPMVLDFLKNEIKRQMEAGEIPVDRPDKVLSERLSAEGVPGIKYRAAGSRAASVDAADAEMNYVIFDENAIKILEKYGIVGPVAVTGMAASQGADSDEGEVT